MTWPLDIGAWGALADTKYKDLAIEFGADDWVLCDVLHPLQLVLNFITSQQPPIRARPKRRLGMFKLSTLKLT